MAYEFTRAARTKTIVKGGFAGETGSGKTYSTLLLAKGLAQGGLVIAGDTERGRMSDYADEFQFDVADIRAPYRPQAYIDFLEQAYSMKPAVVILDSGSHEWVGDGGCLEWHSEVTAEMASKYNENPEKYNFTAWGKVKPTHNKLITLVSVAPCHLLITFRAKEKHEQLKIKQANGYMKTEINPRGLCPDGAEDFPYEMDFIGMMRGNKPGVPEFTYKALSHKWAKFFEPGKPITEATGVALAQYCNGVAQTNTQSSAATKMQTPAAKFQINRGKTKDGFETIEEWRTKFVEWLTKLDDDQVESVLKVNREILKALETTHAEDVAIVRETIRKRIGYSE